MSYRHAWILVFALGAPACDGSDTGGDGGAGGGTTGSGGGTATSTGTSTSSGGPTACPAEEPAVGGSCNVEELGCSYGDSVVPRCRRGFKCLGGAWQPNGLGCDQDPPGCPPPSPPQGGECMQQESLCVAGTLFCVCGPCGGAGCPPPPWAWSCGAPPPAGCPDIVPNDGTACDQQDLVCDYGVMCSEQATARCKDGIWVWDPPVACP